MCNHSCRPNCAIRPRDRVVWALTDVDPGEALQLSYLDGRQLLLWAEMSAVRPVRFSSASVKEFLFNQKQGLYGPWRRPG